MTRRGRRGGLMRSNPRPLIDVLAEELGVPSAVVGATAPSRPITAEQLNEVWRAMAASQERIRRLADVDRGDGEPYQISEPQQRRQEPTKMEKGTVMASNILLETGQKQERQSSSLLFFMFVTPTGVEVSLGKCPHLRRMWGRAEGGFAGTSRIQRTEFQVLAPVLLKMVNIGTTFGSMKKTVNLFVELDPSHAAIEFTGLDGFGSFKGRGKIDYKRSTFREYKEEHNLNDQIMKDMFGLKILQPARVAGKSKVRSLIY